MILGVFASPERAGVVRGTLRESQRRKLISIVGTALIKRDKEGTLELLEARSACNRTDERGEYVSASLQLLLGSTGQVSSCSRLSGLADVLLPGASAIAALIEHPWVDDIRALMEVAGADTVTEKLKSEILEALASRQDSAISPGVADRRAVSPRGLGPHDGPSPSFGRKGSY